MGMLSYRVALATFSRYDRVSEVRFASSLNKSSRRSADGMFGAIQCCIHKAVYKVMGV
jgi:hypothetical protein